MKLKLYNVLLGMVLASFVFMSLQPTFGARRAKPGDTDKILERLDDIETKLDSPSTSATFCISQGRGLALATEWAAGFEAELTLGPGWTSVIYGKADADAKIPAIIPLPGPIPIPIPIPTEAKIEIGGGLGRGMDICAELPIDLHPEDEALLQELARDINIARIGEKGKFQRRASRVLNYAAVRVPGNQRFLETQRNSLAASNAEQDMDDEFDRADAAGDSLLDGGFGETFEGMGVFRNQDIKELLATLEIPVEVTQFMNDPERIFDGLPDLREGEGPLFCNDVGISGTMRGRNARLDKLCSRVENLPTFDRVRNAADRIEGLSDELVDAIAEVVRPLLSNAGETATNTKSRFCASAIGQRRVFDRYCGR